jgi:hypothetical protein
MMIAKLIAKPTAAVVVQRGGCTTLSSMWTEAERDRDVLPALLPRVLCVQSVMLANAAAL